MAALRQELTAQHVVLSVSDAGKLKYEAPAPIPAALVEAMKQHRTELLAQLSPDFKNPSLLVTSDHGVPGGAQRAELLAALQSGVEAVALAPLPESLARLVYAASGNHLNRPGALPSGMVMNLGEYVLASAALYAVGRDPGRQLADLWACHRVWAS